MADFDEQDALPSYTSALLQFLSASNPHLAPIRSPEQSLSSCNRKQSGIKGVNRFRNGWRAKWYENGKLCSKIFHEEEYGEVGALREAIKLRTEMEESGRAAVRENKKYSGVLGVCWDSKQYRWRASIHIYGKRRVKYFPVTPEQNEEQAMHAAIHWRESQHSLPLDSLAI